LVFVAQLMNLFPFAILLAGALSNSSAQSVSGVEQPAPIQVTPAYINALKTEALQRNPLLAARTHQIRAAQLNAGSIPLVPDPKLVAGGMAAERMMRQEDGDLILGVEQEIPVFGKAQAKRKVARTEIAVAEADAEADQVNIARDLAQALFGVALADAAVAISEEDKEWRETMLAIAEERYRFGRSSQVDVLRLQNERSIQGERVKNERNKRESEAERANRILNRFPFTYLPPLALPTNSVPLPQADTLFLAAFKRNRTLRSWNAQTARARAQVKATETYARPDLMLDIESRQYAGAPEWRSTSVMAKLSLPWLNRGAYRKARLRDEQAAQAAEKLAENSKNEIGEAIHHTVAMIDNSRREAALYAGEIIPRTEQTLANAMAGWQNNNDSLRDVLDARRMLLEARLTRIKAVAEEWSAFAELAAICGLSELNEFFELLKTENGNVSGNGSAQ
jgi:outer membrane protein TolC